MSGGADMNQASHIWAMLDELSESDPQAYKKFIQKQIDEGKEMMKPPEPHMCIHTLMYEPKRQTFYLNVCSWQRVHAPKTNDDAIPVAGGSIEQNGTGTDSYAVITVAMNPQTLDDFGRDSQNPQELKAVIGLAIDYVQDTNPGVKLSKNFKMLPKETLCKGNVKAVQKNLLDRFQDQDKKTEDEIKDIQKSFAPVSGFQDTEPFSLLEQMKNITTEENDTKTDSNIKIISEETKRPGLIEELANEEVQLPEPEYDIEDNDNDIKVLISLPGIKSVRECELEISEIDIELIVTNKYKLNLKLPSKIDDSTPAAKFMKKSSTLTIKLQKLS